MARFSSLHMRQGSVSVMLKQVPHSLIFSFTSIMLLLSLGHILRFRVEQEEGETGRGLLSDAGSRDRRSITRSMGSG